MSLWGIFHRQSAQRNFVRLKMRQQNRHLEVQVVSNEKVGIGIPSLILRHVCLFGVGIGTQGPTYATLVPYH